jgi:myo-inositol 2-dehydrogenase/D-chiro-inositol 1-dehydrogenase
VRIGVLGAGRIGALHVRTLHAHPAVKEVLVADLNADRAREIAGPLEAEAVPSIDDLFAADLNGVVVATPTSTHAKLLSRCIDAGLVTFCEKPIALRVDDTREVVERIKASGRVVQVGFQRRFDPGYRRARRLIESGSLGRVYTFRMAGHDPQPPPPAYVETSGGIFRDLHIHDFDITRFLFDAEVAEVYAAGAVLGSEMFAKFDDVDTTAIVVRLDDGTLGVMTGMRHNAAGYDVRVELFGAKDSVSVGLDEQTPLTSLQPDAPSFAEPAYPDFFARFEEAYRAEMEHFVAVVDGTADTPCSAADALEALRIAVACERSLDEHRPVKIAEIS